MLVWCIIVVYHNATILFIVATIERKHEDEKMSRVEHSCLYLFHSKLQTTKANPEYNQRLS